MTREHLLFVYGTLLPGEERHGLLASARAEGPARTPPEWDLVDLGAYPALVPGGTTSVVGELYAVPASELATIDREEGHPILFQRTAVRLADGRDAFAYLLRPEQARGRRRIRSGDWKQRASSASPEPRDSGNWRRWAKSRR